MRRRRTKTRTDVTDSPDGEAVSAVAAAAIAAVLGSEPRAGAGGPAGAPADGLDEPPAPAAAPSSEPEVVAVPEPEAVTLTEPEAAAIPEPAVTPAAEAVSAAVPEEGGQVVGDDAAAAVLDAVAPEPVAAAGFPAADLIVDPAAPPLPAPEPPPVAPEGELEVVFVKGLGGQTVKLRDTQKTRPEEAWASLIATSSWVKPGEPAGSSGGSAPEAGLNPYRATTKARRITNGDIASLCALPSVEAKDDRMSRIAVEAAPASGPVRMPGPTRSQVMAALISSEAAVVREAGEASEAAAAFDRWAEGEGAWRHEPDGADRVPPADEVLAPMMETEAVPEAEAAVAPAPVPAPPPLAVAPAESPPAPAPPLPPSAVSSPLPSPAVSSIAPSPAVAPPSPASVPPPSAAAAVAAAPVVRPVASPPPPGARQVRTLLFDDGPLFSSRPVLVTVIIEPLPRAGDSPGAQPAPPASSTPSAPPASSTVSAPPASSAASAPPVSSTVSAPPASPASAGRPRSKAAAAPVSLLGGVLGLGVSLSRAVGGVLGFGARVREPGAGGQKKSAAAQGGGGKVRPSGVQGSLRR